MSEGENPFKIRKVSIEELPEEDKKLLSWYKASFQDDTLYIVPRKLTLAPGEAKRFVILDKEPSIRIIHTQDGEDIWIPWVKVYYKGFEYIFELRSKSLAMKIAQILLELKSLQGVIVKVRRPKGTEDDKYWQVWFEGLAHLDALNSRLLDWDCYWDNRPKTIDLDELDEDEDETSE